MRQLLCGLLKRGKMQTKNVKRMKYRCSTITVFLLIFVFFAFPQYANGQSLKVSAGFYGGPYYDIETYSESQMKDLAGSEVIMYSGLDSGNYARVCYGWGPTLETLINDANIDTDSVKYFHVKTSDDYGESTTTFSANQLLGARYSFPDLARIMPSNGNVLDFSFSKYEKGAYLVPTILAIGCTEFSRDEARRINSGEEYRQYNTDDLSKKFQYRLIFGQADDGSENVQSSGKWVYEIELQLKGSPGLNIDKKLISGKENEKDSKYILTCSVELPESYNYLSSYAKMQLKKQILNNVKVSGYDDKIIKVTELEDGELLNDGKCQVEIVGSGDTTVQFSYKRSEYKGESTTASASAGITGAADTGEEENSGEKDNGNGKGNVDKGKGVNNEGDSGSDEKGRGIDNDGNKNPDRNGKEGNSENALKKGLKIADRSTATAIAHAEKNPVENSGSESSGGSQWVEFDPENAAIDFSTNDGGLTGITAVAIALLFLGGVGGEITFFRRATGRKAIIIGRIFGRKG